MRVKQICLAFFIGVVAFTTTDLVNRAVYTSSLYESLPRFMRIESPCGWFSAVEPECVANYPLLENELADVAQNAPFGLLPLAVFLSVYRWVIVRFRADPIDGETCCRKCHHILRVAGVETGTQPSTTAQSCSRYRFAFCTRPALGGAVCGWFSFGGTFEPRHCDVVCS